jgi:hypothetical protein
MASNMRARAMTPAEVQAVDAADGYCCAWCVTLGHPKVGDERHHRIPRGRARNQHDAHNVVLLCKEHHDLAHATAAWPWLVPGSTVRGRYVGSDPIYQHVLNGAPTPTYEDVLTAFPDAHPDAARWALARAVRHVTVR